MEIPERIRQKAHDLIMQYGIRSVSMDDIATALGMSKKTIYQYYADKDELVDAVIEDKLEENKTFCKAQRTSANDPVHEAYLAIEMLQEMLQNMNPAVLYDMEKFHPRSFQKFQQFKYNFLYEVLTDNIERGIAAGIYREDINVDIVVKARLENMLLAFNQQLFPKSKYRMVDVEIELTELFLFGLASPKGHKLISKYHEDRLKNNGINSKK